MFKNWDRNELIKKDFTSQRFRIYVIKRYVVERFSSERREFNKGLQFVLKGICWKKWLDSSIIKFKLSTIKISNWITRYYKYPSITKLQILDPNKLTKPYNCLITKIIET